tara:strand:- start:22 stop:279 length:258 start_codon:yes stop_codon:yes gene_type:complete
VQFPQPSAREKVRAHALERLAAAECPLDEAERSALAERQQVEAEKVVGVAVYCPLLKLQELRECIEGNVVEKAFQDSRETRGQGV